MSASMDLNNIQSIISQNISLINFLDFVALKLLRITEILSGILQGNKKLYFHALGRK